MLRIAGLSAVAGLLFALQSAFAADLFYDETPYAAPPAPIWTGVYAGGHLGGAWTGDDSIEKFKRCKDTHKCKCLGCYDTNWKKVSAKHFVSEKDDGVGLLGGVHVGYNWQLPDDTVFGVEADLSFADNIDYLASLRARFGIASDNLLLYATAGVAFAGFESNQLQFANGNVVQNLGDDGDDSKVGLVAGAGAEYRIASNLSLGLEALYYAFGDDENIFEFEKFCKEFKVVHEDDDDLFVVRARVSYHLQEAYAAPLK